LRLIVPQCLSSVKFAVKFCVSQHKNICLYKALIRIDSRAFRHYCMGIGIKNTFCNFSQKVSFLLTMRRNHFVLGRIKRFVRAISNTAGLRLVVPRSVSHCGPACGARKNSRAYAFPRFFRPRRNKSTRFICTKGSIGRAFRKFALRSRLRCPKKFSGLRFSSIFSTAAQ